MLCYNFYTVAWSGIEYVSIKSHFFSFAIDMICSTISIYIFFEILSRAHQLNFNSVVARARTGLSE